MYLEAVLTRVLHVSLITCHVAHLSCLVLVSSTGLSEMLASTQKLGLSNICCQRVTSLPTASIQLEARPLCFPGTKSILETITI